MILLYNTGELGVNTWVVVNQDENKCVVIDLGGDTEEVIDSLNKKGYSVSAIVLTHGHFDHAGGCRRAQVKYQTKVYVPKGDENMVKGQNNCNEEFGLPFDKFNPDVVFEDGSLIIDCFEFRVVSTPGHSQGSVCLIYKDYLFTGDTLMKHSFGRTDLYGGDFKELKKSINKIFSLNKNYEVLPGHGQKTQLFYEKKYNIINDYA